MALLYVVVLTLATGLMLFAIWAMLVGLIGVLFGERMERCPHCGRMGFTDRGQRHTVRVLGQWLGAHRAVAFLYRAPDGGHRYGLGPEQLGAGEGCQRSRVVATAGGHRRVCDQPGEVTAPEARLPESQRRQLIRSR